MEYSLWEDHLLERKGQSDLKDLLRTVVAFANSVKPGHVATVLIGEMDDGSVQGVSNADEIQKTVRKECEKVYPPIVWKSFVYEKGGKRCVRVEIEYSGDTPHFGGPAWVRRGSSTVEASDGVFQRLVEIRLDKVRELCKWEGKNVLVEGDIAGIELEERNIHGHPRWNRPTSANLESVNQFWVTLSHDGVRVSEPLEKLLLSWDHQGNRLKILVRV